MSKTEQWSTPQHVFDGLNDVFHFACDVCADPSNAKCDHYFTKEINGLLQRWEGICWMNPPYGTEIPYWIQKAFESSLWGTIVVCLIPARVDTKWWHTYVSHAAHVTFLKHRLRFGHERNNAPFPSAIVVFGACPWDRNLQAI